MHVFLKTAIEEPWLSLSPLRVRVGDIPEELKIPNAYVLVELDGEPVRRIDIYGLSLDCYPFEELIVWRDFIVLGFGGRVYLIAQDSKEFYIYLQDGYFGHLYPTENYLLVASAGDLSCIGPDGAVVWITEALGIDGVVVDEITTETIYGQGEWDPPGGWRPFRVDARTGVRQS